MTLLWLDLETTGLFPAEDFILEVAWTVTDDKLQGDWEVESHPISYPVDKAVWARLGLNDYVTEMHTNTGLVEEIMGNGESVWHLALIETQILDDLKDWADAGYADAGEPLYLAGASVHFDLAFIREWMPRLAARLSHRVYDTSTLKAFFGSLGWETNIANLGQHRAGNDVEETLSVARLLRDAVGDVMTIAGDETAGGRETFAKQLSEISEYPVTEKPAYSKFANSRAEGEAL